MAHPGGAVGAAAQVESQQARVARTVDRVNRGAIPEWVGHDLVVDAISRALAAVAEAAGADAPRLECWSPDITPVHVGAALIGQGRIQPDCDDLTDEQLVLVGAGVYLRYLVDVVLPAVEAHRVGSRRRMRAALCRQRRAAGGPTLASQWRLVRACRTLPGAPTAQWTLAAVVARSALDELALLDRASHGPPPRLSPPSSMRARCRVAQHAPPAVSRAGSGGVDTRR